MSFYNKSATVVKMAVIGDVVEDPNDLLVLADQISSFEYTLLGADAYKFKIELVNYSDVFLSSILKALNTVLKSSATPEYASLEADESNIKSLPKLLIQWGYEDEQGKPALSAIHTAAVTTVDYKFSQGKEKILVIDAVFMPENKEGSNPEVDATYISEMLVDVDMPMITAPYSRPDLYINRQGTQEHMSISMIVQEIVKDLIEAIDGFEVNIFEDPNNESFEQQALQFALTHKIQADYQDAAVSGGFWAKIGANIKSAWNDEDQELRGGSDSTSLHTYYGAANTGGYGGKQDKYGYGGVAGGHILAAIRDSEAEELYWDKLESIFKFIGITLTRPDFKDILKEVTERSLNRTTATTDNRLYGAYPSIAPATATPSVVDEIPSELTEYRARMSTMVYNFKIDETCGDTGAATNEDVLHYFFGNPENSNFEYIIDVKGVPQTFADELNVHGDFYHDVNGLTDITSSVTPSSIIWPITFQPNTKIILEDGSYSTLQALITSTEASIAQATDANEALAAVRAEEAIPIPEPVKPFVPFTEMSVQDKRNFVNSKIKLTAESQEGESIFQTVRRIVAAYNSYVGGEWAVAEGYVEEDYGNDLEFYIEGVTYIGESFNDVLARLSVKPKEARVTECTIGRKRFVEEIRKETLYEMPINSSDVAFNIDNIAPAAREKMPPDGDDRIQNIVNLTFGFSDSIVKFFDFKGDIRWLRNATIAAVNTNHLSNIYTHLQADQIKKGFVPIAEMLLSDENFIKAMGDIQSDNSSNWFNNNDASNPVDILRTLVDSVNYDALTAGKQRPPKLVKLTDLEHVMDYMKNKASNADIMTGMGINKRLEGGFTGGTGDFKNSMSTFNLFLASMMDAQALDLLMDRKRGRYYLRNENVYDIRAGNTADSGTNTALQNYSDNLNMFSEVRIKTLGIPEISRLVDLTHRAVYLTVSDPSEANSARNHWVTGLYRMVSLNHRISRSEGYSSEFKLLKITT